MSGSDAGQRSSMRMKNGITPRAGLIALAGIGALLAQSWLASPLEMAVFGLPLFVVAAAGYWVAHMLPEQGGEPSRSRAGPVQKLLAALLFALLIAGFAYIVWGRFRDSGLVGWLDAMQARRRGSYSERTSFLTAVCYLLIAAGLGFGALLRFGRGAGPPGGERPRLSPPSARPPRSASATPGRTWAIALAGVVSAIWVVGGALYAHVAWRHRAEARASYHRVDPSQSRSPRSRQEFVALPGRVHPAGYLSVRQGTASTRTFFVPLIGAGADPEAPVHWILQLEGTSLPDLEWPVLAHDLADDLPPVARQEFGRMGLPVAADAVLVELVPSRGGAVRDRAGEDRTFFLGVAGFVTLIVVLMFAIFGLLGLRRRRHGAAGATPAWR